MNTFRIFDPKAEASGAAMHAVASCIRSDQLRPLLDKYGLRQIDPERWYPIKTWLNLLKDISQSQSGALDLIVIGKEIARNIVLPAEIDTVEAALMHLPEIYQRNYRGGDVGYYRVEKQGPKQYRVIGYIPFPSDMTLGVLRGLITRFADKRTRYTVTPDLNDSTNAQNDPDTFTFVINAT